MSENTIDAILVGGGIMSATLGTLLKDLEPNWNIEIFEKLPAPAKESTNPWNNAGTGHSALCELNYMPQAEDGTLTTEKAVNIAKQFQISRQWWAKQVEEGTLTNPKSFINSVPHMTFVQGTENMDYLRRRHSLITQEPLFNDMLYSENPSQIAEWAPLLVDRRPKDEPIAATISRSGTDVNFGEITRQLLDSLQKKGVTLNYEQQIQKLERLKDGTWKAHIRSMCGYGTKTVTARFVFVGAGGNALTLLQTSKIPEIKGYAGFPISGKFLRCDNPEIVRHHQAKVYGKAAVGAPPMSVPHLDTRVIDGKKSLLFGPYAGFSPNYLKSGSWLDLPRSIRVHNILPMIRVGLNERSLVSYLLKELMASPEKQLELLRQYMPTAQSKHWRMITAGQRVQAIKKHPATGGQLVFGTEIINSADGSLAGLLGASPGASVAVHAMIDVLNRCFPENYKNKWRQKLEKQLTSLDGDQQKAYASQKITAATLELAS